MVNVSLVRDAHPPTREATGELKISATPTRAAVFVDNQFAGHVDEFDGIGKAMLLTPDATLSALLYPAICHLRPWLTCVLTRSSRFRLNW